MRVSGVWRTGLIVLTVFAVAWACAIVWWRVRDVTPDGTGMLVWLVAVPIGILATLWIVARLRRGAAANRQETEAAADVPAAEDEAQPLRPPYVLAAAASLGCGEGAQALAAGLAQMPRPGLHPTLRDRDGLPVLAAFSKELDTAAVEARLPAAAGRRHADVHLRAMALLEPVALELFDAAAGLLPPLPEAEERVVAGLRRRVSAVPEEIGGVHVVALLPQDMPPPLRSACEAWLRELAAEAGLDPRRSRLEVATAADADSVWKRVGELLREEANAGDDWQILLASASLIGERGLHALVAGGRLATASRTEGLVPGEGAAGLLLRPAGTVRPLADRPVPVLAAMRTDARGQASPRQSGRAGGDLLGVLMETASVPGDSVAAVLSDADQRPSRLVEAAVAASAACPELDPAADCPALGTASGHLGHVAPLALLALASARTLEAGAPVLALSVAPEHSRTAALLRIADAEDIPQTPPSEAGAAPDLAA